MEEERRCERQEVCESSAATPAPVDELVEVVDARQGRKRQASEEFLASPVEETAGSSVEKPAGAFGNVAKRRRSIEVIDLTGAEDQQKIELIDLTKKDSQKLVELIDLTGNEDTVTIITLHEGEPDQGSHLIVEKLALAPAVQEYCLFDCSNDDVVRCSACEIYTAMSIENCAYRRSISIVHASSIFSCLSHCALHKH